jgi:nicotinate phosphoribosyltransferase
MVDDVAAGDVIGLADEAPPAGATPLLECVMREGRRVTSAPSVAELQRQSRARIAQLPAGIRRLDAAGAYPVSLSAALEEAGRDVAARAARR